METVTEYMPKNTSNIINNLIQSVSKLEKEMKMLKHREKNKNIQCYGRSPCKGVGQ